MEFYRYIPMVLSIAMTAHAETIKLTPFNETWILLNLFFKRFTRVNKKMFKGKSSNYSF